MIPADRIRKAVLALLLLIVFAGCSERGREQPQASKPQGQQLDPRTRVLLRQANEALAARDYQRALTHLDAINQYNPGLPEAQFLRGHVSLGLKQLSRARAAFKAILTRYPRYEAAWHSLGDVSFAEGDFREALRYYFREEAINPKPETWYNIANAYRMLEMPDSALIAYDASTRLQPSYAPSHYGAAELLETRGEFEDALERARTAAKSDPTNVKYQYMVGNLLFRTNRLDEAERVLREAAERAPWDYSTLYTLGQVLQQQGKSTEASDMLARAQDAREREAEIRDAERNASLHRDSARAQVALAEDLVRSGRFAEALDQFKLAHALDPADLSVQQNIASLLLGQGDATGALERCTEIVRQDSSRVGAWVIMSAAYAQLGRRKESGDAWARAIRLDPNHPTVQQVLRRN